VKLSTGESFPSDVIVWTAGVMAHPYVRNTDFPVDARGRITAKATLQVADGDEVVPGAWTAGDVSAVPDLSGFGVGGYCVPNAQHAVRQAKLLSKNIVAQLRGEGIKEYFHKPLGAVAGLGIGIGVYQWKGLAIKGLLAWFMHRGYHGLAVPTWERKIRVFAGWVWNFFLRRDIVSNSAIKGPRLEFQTYASKSAKK
jgi:NADH dehydrogenase